MNANLQFEFIAKAFQVCTGHLRPGKSDVSGTPYEEREAAWQEWSDDNRKIISAFVVAAKYVLLEEDEPFPFAPAPQQPCGKCGGKGIIFVGDAPNYSITSEASRCHNCQGTGREQ